MSEAIAFDTHLFVKNLTASGFTEAQAEALADEQAHLLDSNLATKTDILATRSDLKVKIEQVRSDVQKAKADLLKWMVGALTAHAALIAGVVAGMFRFLG